MVLTFESVDIILKSLTIQIKAIEQYFAVVLFIEGGAWGFLEEEEEDFAVQGGSSF